MNVPTHRQRAGLRSIAPVFATTDLERWNNLLRYGTPAATTYDLVENDPSSAPTSSATSSCRCGTSATSPPPARIRLARVAEFTRRREHRCGVGRR